MRKHRVGRHMSWWVVPLLFHPVADPDPRLLEAIDWYTGVAGSVDDVKARELLLEVVGDTGSPLSRMWVARCHSRGRMGFERDVELARALAREVFGEVREMARLGEPEAIFLMGTAFDEALGEPEDASAAAEFFRRAANVGHVLSQHNLGNLYAAGRGVAQNPTAAVRWWTLAADQGDAITQLRLGEAYEAGNGVEPDIATAVGWYREAAKRGNGAAREALVRLGLTAPLPPPTPPAPYTIYVMSKRPTLTVSRGRIMSPMTISDGEDTAGGRAWRTNLALSRYFEEALRLD